MMARAEGAILRAANSNQFRHECKCDGRKERRDEGQIGKAKRGEKED